MASQTQFVPLSPPPRSLRVSQRPPTACRECSQRKVRCDKETPCGRCVRLSKTCTREVVRISKSLSLHRDELRFLRALRARLVALGPSCHDAVADIDRRVHFLEHGKSAASDDGPPQPDANDMNGAAMGVDPAMHSPAPTDEDEMRSSYGGTATVASPTSMATSASTPVVSVQPRTVQYQHQQQHQHQRMPTTHQLDDNHASILTGFEFLAWGRHSQACFPHRRCRCYQNRRYSELASINCDAAWVGRQAMTLRADASDSDPTEPSVLLPPRVARQVVAFHMDHLRWHHNAFHGPTFVAQCEQFWRTGTADHPLWLALYFAVCSVSLWTLLNNEPYRREVTGDWDFDEALVSRQFQAMVHTLYGENFLENLSLYAVQAIVISTRIAHNLDRTDLNAILVGAAVRIAHCLGLHKIADPVADPPDEDIEGTEVDAWHERVEIETGKRVWLQLVIQDHFQIPYTDTYVIHPSQYITPLPDNCNDEDMVARPGREPTNSSYVRMLGRTASLIPPLLDGLGPMGARKPPAEAYQHILACDRVMRANVAQIPEFLLRDDAAPAATKTPWLALARRTLAISAAEKIIMIHRPVLYDSFQGGPAFRHTRTTCVAAATTILREHEQALAEQTLSIWTHSAFCVTAAVVLGLELFHRTDHTDDTAHAYRQTLARAADRLRHRRCDAMAKRGAVLIDTLLAAEEDLVLRLMRTARSGDASTAHHQAAIINDMLGRHEIMARFLARAPPKPDSSVGGGGGSAGSTPVAMGGGVSGGVGGPAMDVSPPPAVSLYQGPLLPNASNRGNSGNAGHSANHDGMNALLTSMDLDTSQDFESWFNNVFAPVYDPLL
ncbi:hypothetical protein HMPREF1624_05782 [Sporothrix schenckii ATCC 58251]|uniref:Zn(2)-C6 fungal-type domain-containing protein n=1 Tax=Sporothrix schenckii (strain ATCC 58251 / de Perez 2211183) TaxID=1391915 RepID=U7PRP4_SPOS1|nr:hypothetical protein HMPREF1624_05782 [Sporothrix schenckii ATCC 58251]